MKTSIILDIISGLLISYDLILSNQKAIRVNVKLNGILRLPRVKVLQFAFLWGIPLALGVITGLITFFVSRESNNFSNIDNTWFFIFMAGFIIAMSVVFLLSHIIDWLYKWRHWKEDPYLSIFWGTIITFVSAIAIFIKTYTIPELPSLTVGILYGSVLLGGSVLITTFLRWFLTNDPNPTSIKNPRVLARLGLLIFIISKIIELSN